MTTSLIAKNKKIELVRKMVAYLRTGNHVGCDELVSYILDGFNKRQYSLKDIDINLTESELERLRFNGCKIAARDWLMCLRRNPDRAEEILPYLQGTIHNGHLSPADIDVGENLFSRGIH